MTGFYFVLSILLLTAPRILIAQSFITEDGHVEFTSSVPLHSFTGSSDHLNGLIDLDENLLDFYIDLKTLDTGNGRRDRDMYRTLNTDEFPFAEFTGRLTTVFDTDSEMEQSVTATGEFTVNGVTRDLTVDGTLENTAGGIHLKSSWIIDITDYDIEPPGILFYKVDEEMDIRIDAVLIKQDD